MVIITQDRSINQRICPLMKVFMWRLMTNHSSLTLIRTRSTFNILCVCVGVCVCDKKMKETTEGETVQQYNTLWLCGNVWFFRHGAGHAILLISVPRTVTDRAHQEKNRPWSTLTGQTNTISFNPIHTYIGICNKGY